VRLLGPSTEESEVPLRANGSLSMNRALMGAGLVDRVPVALFPVITDQTGVGPAPKSSSTGPPCMSESNHAPNPRL
jgi:hypothetical protein